MSTYDDQIQLEDDMMRLGTEKFLETVEASDDFNSPLVKTLEKMIERLTGAIKSATAKERVNYKSGHKPLLMKISDARFYINKKNTKTGFEYLPATPDQLSFIVMRSLMTNMANGDLKVVNISTQIGNTIHSNIVGDDALSVFECGKVSLVLLQLAQDNFTDILTFRKDFFDTDSKHMEWLVGLSEEFRVKYESKLQNIAMMNNVIYPMIYRPEYWDSTGNNGGFYSDQLKVNAIKKRNVGEDANINANIAKGMNAIQSTPWSVNLDVLNLFDQYGEDGPESLKKAFPASVPDDENAPFPNVKYADMSEDQKKIHRKWSRKVRLNKKKRQGRVSNILSRCSSVEQARMFKDYPEIFFPHDLDSRMRIYNKCMTGLNTQGSDHQKGLIKFKPTQVKTLDGARWMMINMANLVGHDKLELDERVAWTIANEQLLRDVVKDPIKCQLWHGWDKPFQGYAAAVEYVKWLDNPQAFINTHVQLDGLCNGVQNLAAITRDRIVAPHVGLIKTKKRGDVYGYVCDGVISDLRGVGSPFGVEWLSSNLLDRKITKTPVMTRSYGAKLYGIKEGIQEFIIDSGKEDHFSDPFKSGNWMGERIWDNMDESLKGPMAFMEWVQTCAGIIASVNLPLIWDNPAGMQCIQSPKILKRKNINIRFNGKHTNYQMLTHTNKINKAKMESSSSPNITHSCDASHLSITTNRCEDVGIEDFAMVHDSFGSAPDDAATLLHEAKEAWVDIYEQNWPQKWFDQWVDFLRENGEYEAAANLPHYTDFFEMGDLQASEVRESDFFFA